MNHSDAYRGRKVVVMGLGRFGGGIAVTRWLVEQGAEVVVTDLAPAEKLAESIARLEGLPIAFRLGGHDVADLDGCSLMVVSPAVPKDQSEFVAEARRRGIPLSSEMNIFIDNCPARRVVGITGSAGKSTSTALLGAIGEAAVQLGQGPRMWIGGNIGCSLLQNLDEIDSEDVVVLELSSFQLEDLGTLKWSPGYAVITNIKPNHLDRHGTLENYAEAKLNIIRYQKPGDMIYISGEDDELAEYVGRVNPPSTVHLCAFDPVFQDVLNLPGAHNRLNASAAIAVARDLGYGDDAIADGLQAFRGLSHRLEFVAERGGVSYYNDSKSTTPESSLIALNAFDRPVVMLVGGRDKGMSFDALSQAIAARAKAAICYGEIGPALADRIKGCLGSVERPADVRHAHTLAEAVKLAGALACSGDVVVLSPACTSYDQFNNYEERGAAFRRAVHHLDAE